MNLGIFNAREKVPSSLCKLDENLVECVEFQNFVINDIGFFSFKINLDHIPFNLSFWNLYDYSPYDTISFQPM